MGCDFRGWTQPGSDVKQRTNYFRGESALMDRVWEHYDMLQDPMFSVLHNALCLKVTWLKGIWKLFWGM